MPSKWAAPGDQPRYLRSSQVAELLNVSRETVTRWAKEGKLPVLKTLGGQRRYEEAAIRKLVVDLTVNTVAVGEEVSR